MREKGIKFNITERPDFFESLEQAKVLLENIENS